MSFYPDSFDPRSQVLGLLELVEIDAPSGPARFMVGQQGKFTDISGNVWHGSQLVSISDIEWSRSGTAPAGSVEFSYYQDPTAVSLIDKLKESGDDLLNGRSIKFYTQPIGDVSELYAPIYAPELEGEFTCGALSFTAQGSVSRKLSLKFEGSFGARLSSRSFTLTTTDHASLTGSANPSLEFMPKTASVTMPVLYG